MPTETTKTVLVAGGSGRLGRYLVAELMRDHRVSVFDLLPPDAADHFVQGDDTASLPDLARPEWQICDAGLPESRSFVAPEDAARAFRCALETPGIGWGVYFLAAPETHTSKPTLDVFRRAYGDPGHIPGATDLARNSTATIYDIATTEGALGWSARNQWADLLAAAISDAGRAIEAAS